MGIAYLTVAIIRLNGAHGLRDPAAVARLKTMWPTANPWVLRQIARILVGALGKDGAGLELSAMHRPGDIDDRPSTRMDTFLAELVLYA